MNELDIDLLNDLLAKYGHAKLANKLADLETANKFRDSLSLSDSLSDLPTNELAEMMIG